MLVILCAFLIVLFFLSWQDNGKSQIWLSSLGTTFAGRPRISFCKRTLPFWLWGVPSTPGTSLGVSQLHHQIVLQREKPEVRPATGWHHKTFRSMKTHTLHTHAHRYTYYSHTFSWTITGSNWGKIHCEIDVYSAGQVDLRTNLLECSPGCLPSFGFTQRTYQGSFDIRISVRPARLLLNCVATCGMENQTVMVSLSACSILFLEQVNSSVVPNSKLLSLL